MARDTDGTSEAGLEGGGLLGLGLAFLLHGFGDSGTVPPEDVIDMSKGATAIPGEVTEARQSGLVVKFVQEPVGWYWQMPDGSRAKYTGDY